MGHAGADAEVGLPHRRRDRRRPGPRPAGGAPRRLLVEAGLATPDELLARYDEVGWQVRRVAEEVLARAEADQRGRGRGAAGPAPPGAGGPRRRRGRPTRAAGPSAAARLEAFGGRLPEQAGPLTLAQTINADAHRRAGRQPGSGGLRRGRGGARAASTGSPRACGTGSAPAGSSTRCSTRRRSSAWRSAPGWPGCCRSRRSSTWPTCTTPRTSCAARRPRMQFFSQGAYRNPMVVRVAGLAYQEGFGGHFHNDNSVAVLRDIPGLVVAVPGPARRRRADAAHLPGRGRRSTAASACSWSRSRSTTPGTCYGDGDNGWLAPYAAAGRLGARRTSRSAGPASTATGERPDHRHVRQRGADVAAGRGPAGRARASACRVVDLRWLSPAAGGRPGPRGGGDRPGADRRRDPPHRRGRRGRAGRAGRRRLRRRGPPGRRGRLVRSARSGRATRPGLRRARSTQGAHSLLGAGRPYLSTRIGAPLARGARTVWTTR